MGRKRINFGLKPSTLPFRRVASGAFVRLFCIPDNTKVLPLGTKGTIDVPAKRYFTIIADDVVFAGSSAKIVRLGVS